MNEPLPIDKPLPQPEDPLELNPYVAFEVMDHPQHDLPSGNKQPGVLAIVISVLVGIVTAIVAFCLAFFVTCAGMVSWENGRNFSFERLIAISVFTAIVAAVLVSWRVSALFRVIKR